MQKHFLRIATIFLVILLGIILFEIRTLATSETGTNITIGGNSQEETGAEITVGRNTQETAETEETETEEDIEENENQHENEELSDSLEKENEEELDSTNEPQKNTTTTGIPMTGSVATSQSIRTVSTLPEANLGLNNILNVILIAIGVIIILLAIAILIRIK